MLGDAASDHTLRRTVEERVMAWLVVLLLALVAELALVIVLGRAMTEQYETDDDAPGADRPDSWPLVGP